MPEFQIKKGNVVFAANSNFNTLAYIVTGRVLMQLPGTQIELTEKDIIGLIDLTTHIHSCDYIALEDTVVETYPCNNYSDFSRLITSQSMCGAVFDGFARQLQAFLDTYTLMRYECSTMFAYLHNSYDDYCNFCKKSVTTPKELPGLVDFPSLSLDEVIDNWKLQYYSDFKEVFSQPDLSRIQAHPSFYIGLIHFGCQDMQSLLNSFQTMHDYLHELSFFLINEDSTDFLDLYSSLLIPMAREGSDTLPVTAALSRLMLHIEGIHSIDREMYKKRLADYNTLLRKLEDMSFAAADKAYQKQVAETTNLLHNSVDIILDFAEYSGEQAILFKRTLEAYKKMPDKSATTDEAMSARKALTAQFYELYRAVFLNSTKTSDVPPVILMFLNFGFVDEELAGNDNASYLYSISTNFHGDEEKQIYTIYEWLLAIYNGKKAPRKNEFDTDYAAHVNELLRAGSINSEQASEMLGDTTQKVMFELTNMFPSANRMTYGRVTTFCPVFSDHNVSKPLEECLCTPDKIIGFLDEIRQADYSVFYRQFMYTSTEFNIAREYIQKEVLPDFILLPNVGIRGGVWQEIEGNDRLSPATFLLPVFSLESLQMILTRMTGEFRWEMCRRVQGAKWNDVTEHSLTSDYYDYLQFFRKNNELSTEVKEKLSVQLKKCKNNFKEFFVIDYMCWILYECKGIPRMNRYARNILFAYCPFTKSVRDSLLSNPLYEQTIQKAAVKLAKEQRRIDALIYRCRKNQGKCPPELEAQKAFLER